MNRRTFLSRFGIGVSVIVAIWRSPQSRRVPAQTWNDITRSTCPAWQAQPQSAAAYDNLRSAMRDIYNQCSVPSDDAVYWLSPDGPYRLGDGAAELLRDVEIPS